MHSYTYYIYGRRKEVSRYVLGNVRVPAAGDLTSEEYVTSERKCMISASPPVSIAAWTAPMLRRTSIALAMTPRARTACGRMAFSTARKSLPGCQADRGSQRQVVARVFDAAIIAADYLLNQR
jgi:hypothetical protein